MKCPTCDDKGYQISSIAKDNTNRPLIIKCPNPNCNHTKGYYKEIQSRFSEHTKSIDQERDTCSNLINKSSPKYTDKPLSQDNSKLAKECLDLLDNPNKTLDPTKDKGSPGPYQVSHELTRQESYDLYSNLNPAAIDQIIDAQERLGAAFSLVLDTPWGPKMIKDLPEANRVTKMIDEYMSRAEELSYAESQDNMLVFPFPQRLGF